MANDKYVRLVNRLVQLTREGSLTWESTVGMDTYQSSFPTYGVRIWSDERDGGELDYVLQIVNSEGTVIDEIRDTSFAPGDFGQSSAFREMGDLFRLAKRKALGADEAIDRILKDLDDIPF
jgi:hypothetical protein